jgi:PKD domain-containing protein
MKNFIIALFVSTLFLTIGSCKDAIESGVDCFFEVQFVTIHADLDSINPKLMHFQFVYDGSDGVTLDHSINWNFGDGESVTADTIIDHEYAETGSYEAIASFTLHDQHGTCSSSSKKQIVIN